MIVLPPPSKNSPTETGCRGYTNLDEMLADPAVQIVTIGTPSGAHMEPAVAAAEAGKHVIVEKPLEITLKRCDKIIAACAKNKVKLSTVFPSRFHDSSQELKRAIEAKRFGRLDPRRCLREMVSHATVLRQRRLGGAPGNWTAAGADEPGRT